MPLLLNVDGTPLPPSDVARAVRRVDAALDLLWVAAMAQWAVVAPWRPSDPRRELVQTGALGDGAAFDIVCFLPKDCPVEQAESYLRRGLVSSSRDDITKMLDQLHRFNEQQEEANADRAAEPVLDDLDSVAGRRLTNTATSFLNDATQKRGKKS